MSKSKVLSVRLSLEALQSCFDLTEALGVPTNGASGAISRSIETLTRDLRAKGTLPTYQPVELEHLLQSFLIKKNPTSMLSLESLSNFEHRPAIDRRDYTSTSFAPPLQTLQTVQTLQTLQTVERSSTEIYEERIEYDDLIEEKILDEIRKDEEDLLNKILIGDWP